MKKRILASLLSILMVLSLLPTTVFASGTEWSYPTATITTPFAQGDGTESNPFQISSAQELANLAYLVNTGTTYGEGSKYNQAYYVQTANIDLNSQEWTPIGNTQEAYDEGAYLNKAFCGHYDGDKKTISNLKITSLDNAGKQVSTYVVGLFGTLGDGAEIKDVVVTGANIDLSEVTDGVVFSGIIAGSSTTSDDNKSISISSCTVSGTVKGNGKDGAYAGIVGNIGGYGYVSWNGSAIHGVTTISNNTNNANISANGDKVAGIVAFIRKVADSQIIQNNTNTGTISATDKACGGIVGFIGSGDASLKLPNGNTNTGAVSGGEIGGRIIPLLLDDCTVNQNTVAEDYSSIGGTIGSNVTFQGDSVSAVYQFGKTEGTSITFDKVPAGQIQFSGQVGNPTIKQTTSGSLRLILGWENGTNNLHTVGDSTATSAHSYEITVQTGTSVSSIVAYEDVSFVIDGNVSATVNGTKTAFQFGANADSGALITLNSATELSDDSLMKSGKIAFGTTNGSLTIGEGKMLTLTGGTINGRPIEGGYEYPMTVSNTGKLISYNGAVSVRKTLGEADHYTGVIFNLENGNEYCRVYTADCTSISVPAYPSDLGDYTFAGWYKNGTAFVATTVQDGDSYTAKVVSNITFNANEGTCDTTSVQVVKGDSISTLPEPTRTGYTFNGWYTAAEGGNKVETTTVPNGSTTYYAQWTPNTYTISFSGGTGATGETTSVSATYDQPATLTANGFTMANKNFAGWDTNSSANNIVYADGGEVENLTTEANGTVTLYAVWTDKSVLDLDKTVQTYPYDGQAKAFKAEGFTVSYKMGNTVIYTPVDAGTYDVMISAVETDTTAAYPETTITGGLVINKAALTITADNKSIYVGDTLPEYTYTVTGWKGEDGGQAEELLSGIEIGCPEADASTVGTYAISMTGPESISNYTLSYENGTLTVSRRSSGSGGSSNTTTTTTKNDDGSTTTTTTNKTTGTVTETTKNTDGSTETVETKKDGTVTTTTKAADGSSAKVVENADGTTEIEASTSKAAVREAEKSGTPVALPLEVAASENASDAPDVEVSLPAADSTVAVSINVKNITPGTVAMLVGDDGTTEVIRKSVADDDEIVIPLDGSATVKIVNNEKAFTDTDNHWAEGAIDFVTARELYAGTSATTFSPDNTMTRAMLARVLHNLESNPDHAFDGTFSDVNAHWAADSIHWAAERGIVGGYPNGSFGADNNITREQLAVMLWRYAGSPESSHDLSHFNDVANISSYAKVALAWANEHGIVGGVGNNTMNPQGNATRAQVATMLMRMMQNTF